ncbi:uncharacterized protein LOC106079075 isoform X1 [Biomphalaria glabrata]|uniref:Uncharacterized protein LOC106079075 isoform X1 n=1 Tax=Biomphalaria glabrata TaxID=6526 RepID=A0A9W3B4E1_BIOGL|nr:uncharacterized protein LOC106079075 isoform X1 [Biomphalaria glabrata]XP_055894388.1 uncharacterized protein LOC106079075 isoform X1 [Biomphalaria glabrata]XP_055894389.1 uncharacterized protein LOC106079075 isoform X1 [Biomphalaria glabrata]XP_055894391.1 uncharacterized protein LOC106079075 isoform X1 [Biomphalaria glabrata]
MALQRLTSIILLLSALCLSTRQTVAVRNASETDGGKPLGTAWLESGTDKMGHPLICTVSTQEDLHEFIDMSEDREKATLFEFHITLRNYTFNPFSNVTGLHFKPWLWYLTKSQHGRTLLMLSFHYDVLSMNILTIGVKESDLVLTDSPFGCFGQLVTSSQVSAVRGLLLNRKGKDKGSSRWVLNPDSQDFACNQVIEDRSGSADFVYNCCYRDLNDPDGKNIMCTTKGDDFWINILYLAITSIKIMMFLFCPKFLPNNVYSAAYVASEYVIDLKKTIKMKLFISEKNDTNITYKHRLTLEQISNWKKLRETIDQMPFDETIPIKISKLKIKVKGKRILPENDPPTGLMRTIYDNLIRCKMKNLDPFKDCCETSIYASMEPKFRHKITWHKFVQLTVKTFMLILIPVPYYIRLLIYFMFEEEELSLRQAAVDANGLTTSFNFYRSNVIQYFSPTHGVFIATYVFYFLIGLIIGFSDQNFREKLKDICRAALQDMNSVSQTGVLGIIIRLILFPFKRCGLLGFLLAPIYLVFIMPACMVIFVLYCVPTVYLSIRLPYHARKLANESAALEEAEKNKRIIKMQKLGKKLSKIDKSAHEPDMTHTADNYCCPDEYDFQGFTSIKSVFLQIITAVFCLCILYSIALVFSESIGLFVEVMAFTMMGIIVNAGSVLKYVTMVLLVFVYMNDCYSNVYENYLTFNKAIMDEIIERTTTDLRKIASMPSSQQANTAFQVRCVDETKELIPSLNFDKKEIRWKIGQLLLFLDCYDTPRIPLRMFQKLCQVRVHGAPGPVYINLLAATGKFMIIVIFLMFVMIVVMAFGNVHAMSSANTTLATLAGGFVPMLLKNVLSSKGTRLSLKTVSFKGQIDEIIEEYKQYWPVVDLLIQRQVPGEDDAEEEKKEGDKQDSPRPDSREEDSKKNNNIEKDKHDSGNNDDSKLDKVKDEKSDTIAKHDEFAKDNGDLLENVVPKTEYDVDLFIDFSVADTGGWSLSGSNESLSTERDRMMPGYFDPNKVVIDMEPLEKVRSRYEPPPPSYQQNQQQGSPPQYRRTTPAALQPQVPLVVMFAHTDTN